MKALLMVGVLVVAVVAFGLAMKDGQVETVKVQTAERATRPVVETEAERFSAIVRSWTVKYREKEAARNGMVTDGSLKAGRDLAVWEFLKPRDFKFNSWDVAISSVSGREKAYCPVWMRESGCILLSVQLMAPGVDGTGGLRSGGGPGLGGKRGGLSLKVVVEDNAEWGKFLGARKSGDVVEISGRFLPRLATNLGSEGRRVPREPSDVEETLSLSDYFAVNPDYNVFVTSMKVK